MSLHVIIRCVLALIIAFYLSYHGISKKSLDLSGAVAAVVVGFISFASSYRFGAMLILFYYSSSKFTKYKEHIKSKIEEGHIKGGQRNYKQVFASSLLATIIAVFYLYYCGEDSYVSFGSGENANKVHIFRDLNMSQSTLSSYLWAIYVAHYATATADTWASELGVLSRSRPRLVTSLFLSSVPAGTNGGMSVIGTAASAAGGLFIGGIFWIGALFVKQSDPLFSQFPMVIFGLICGVLGSLIDSLLGATLQATYYSVDKKCIVKTSHSRGEHVADKSIKRICGWDILSNEAVNLFSIFLTMLLSVWIAPNVFCWIDSNQCFEADRVNGLIFALFLRK